MKQLKSFFQSFNEYNLTIQKAMFIASLVLLVVGLLIRKNITFSFLIIMVASLAYGFLTFCLCEKHQARKKFKIMALTVGACIGGILSSALFTINFPKFLYIAIDFVCIIVAFVVGSPSKEKNEDGWKMINDIITKDIYASDGTLNPGDTFLGYDDETGKPNIVPYKDRFLHFLILGVTGCGKTSQSLIPMVANDMESKDLGIVCLDPKGDFAETVCALAVAKGRGDEVTYFNPILSDCPYFNPMVGDLDSVSECLVTTFKKLENEQQTFFANMDEMLMRRCIKVTKWLYNDDANLNDINILMNNVDGEGVKMLTKLKDTVFEDKLIEGEVKEIYSWFTNDYYTGLSGQRSATKTYEQCSGVRNQVSKLLANSLVKRLLCPLNKDGSKRTLKQMEYGEYIDFDGVLANGGILAMSSAQGELRELGTFIGYFLILSFESAVFRRPGDENTRKGVIFYVDEFQKYANDGYNDLLTQGRSYRVSSVLATQTRAGIAANSQGQEGKNLIETVSSNCRNKVIYPGCSYEDASYYSKEFGEHKEKKERVSTSRSRALLTKYVPAQQNESVSTEEKDVADFKPDDIIYRPFGEAISVSVKNNTLQRPKVIKLKFIDYELKKRCDAYIAEEIRPRQINYVNEVYEDQHEAINERKDVKIENPYGNDAALDLGSEFKDDNGPFASLDDIM